MMELIEALSSPFRAQSRAMGPWNAATPSSSKLPTCSSQSFCAIRSRSCPLCVTTFPSNTPTQQPTALPAVRAHNVLNLT